MGRTPGEYAQLVGADDRPVVDVEGEGNLVVNDSDAILIRLAPDMAAMLRRLEWSGYKNGPCPVCNLFERHYPYCELDALLTEVGREG